MISKVHHVLFCMILSVTLWLTIGQGDTAQVIYITPNSVEVPCPDHSQPCFTLSEIASSLSEITNLSQSIELVVLPGEHHLEYNISIIKNVTGFSMHSSSSTFEASQIICRVNETSFQFKQINKVWIYGLKFVGCGNNIVELIENLTVEHATFLGKNGSGTALILNESNAAILQTTFDSNMVGTFGRDNPTSSHYVGGAIFAIHSNMEIRNSKFTRNHARNLGGAIYNQLGSNITLFNTTFTENSVCMDSIPCLGGAICYINGHFRQLAEHRTQLRIINSTFSHNEALSGAALIILHTDVDVRFSYFDNNYSPYSSSIHFLDLIKTSHLRVNGSVFYNNSGSTLWIKGVKSVTLTNSQFLNNKGQVGGPGPGVLFLFDASLIIKGCHFSSNSGALGGVLSPFQCNVTICDCEFDANHATVDLSVNNVSNGGVLMSTDSYITISNTNFTNNRAEDGDGGVLALDINVTVIIDTCTFLDNHAQKTGGAIHADQSTIVFRGTNYIMRNHADQGGGISVMSYSVLDVNGELVVSNNTASIGGGTILSLYSQLKCEHDSCTIRYKQNMAVKNGGGIFVLNSIISMSVGTNSIINPSIHFIENNAHHGGGMYLASSARIEVRKTINQLVQPQLSLIFANNRADYGGALFVNDKTYFDTCLLHEQCFIHVFSANLLGQIINNNTNTQIDTMKFVGNSASKVGSVLYGGLLDRCIIDQNIMIIAKNRVQVDGVTFFKNISTMSGNKGIAISSDPVRICLCSLDGKPDCSGIIPIIEVRKGENSSIPLAAVDQIGQPLTNTTTIILAQLNHTESGLGVSQFAQVTRNPCSNLTFSILSYFPLEELTLFADGPCRNNEKSVLKLPILFKKCTCPVGFHPRTLEIDNNCVCDCDPQLLPKYITSCDLKTHTLTRLGNFWISYLNTINDTNQYSYLTYPYCPLDYCLPPDTNVEINLNVPNGSDVQCQNNRSGLLCGVCHPGLSVSLGTSRCISCDGGHDLWWLILIFITAGVILVAVLLVLNMTVAVGTINGLILYANIIGAISSTFFPTFSSKPAYVIVSWLNLELGFDACFVDGLDTYTKTWIQMAFPTYVIFLLIIMIVWSEYSLRFSSLIGRKNPVALLATLIFLSYAKVLSTIITALLFITLEYPDGSHKVVWLPDASVDYLSVKHLILVVVAIVILLVGSVYTILLLFWQWIRKWAVGKISHKVCYFFDIYQAPYNLKHRYWPGLLLLARIILYLLFALNQSGDPKVNLIGIIIIMCSLLLLKGVCGGVYKNRIIDSLEVISYFNAAAFSAVQLYTLQSGKSQNISAFLSVSITAVLLVMVVIYHIHTAVVRKLWQKYKSKIGHSRRRGPVTQNRPQGSEMKPLYYFHDSIEAESVSVSIVEFPGAESCSGDDNNVIKDDKTLNVVNSESEEDTVELK